MKPAIPIQTLTHGRNARHHKEYVYEYIIRLRAGHKFNHTVSQNAPGHTIEVKALESTAVKGNIQNGGPFMKDIWGFYGFSLIGRIR